MFSDNNNNASSTVEDFFSLSVDDSAYVSFLKNQHVRGWYDIHELRSILSDNRLDTERKKCLCRAMSNFLKDEVYPKQEVELNRCIDADFLNVLIQDNDLLDVFLTFLSNMYSKNKKRFLDELTKEQFDNRSILSKISRINPDKLNDVLKVLKDFYGNERGSHEQFEAIYGHLVQCVEEARIGKAEVVKAILDFLKKEVYPKQDQKADLLKKLKGDENFIRYLIKSDGLLPVLLTFLSDMYLEDKHRFYDELTNVQFGFGDILSQINRHGFAKLKVVFKFLIEFYGEKKDSHSQHKKVDNMQCVVAVLEKKDKDGRSVLSRLARALCTDQGIFGSYKANETDPLLSKLDAHIKILRNEMKSNNSQQLFEKIVILMVLQNALIFSEKERWYDVFSTWQNASLFRNPEKNNFAIISEHRKVGPFWSLFRTVSGKEKTASQCLCEELSRDLLEEQNSLARRAPRRV